MTCSLLLLLSERNSMTLVQATVTPLSLLGGRACPICFVTKMGDLFGHSNIIHESKFDIPDRDSKDLSSIGSKFSIFHEVTIIVGSYTFLTSTVIVSCNCVGLGETVMKAKSVKLCFSK